MAFSQILLAIVFLASYALALPPGSAAGDYQTHEYNFNPFAAVTGNPCLHMRVAIGPYKAGEICVFWEQKYSKINTFFTRDDESLDRALRLSNSGKSTPKVEGLRIQWALFHVPPNVDQEDDKNWQIVNPVVSLSSNAVANQKFGVESARPWGPGPATDHMNHHLYFDPATIKFDGDSYRIFLSTNWIDQHGNVIW